LSYQRWRNWVATPVAAVQWFLHWRRQGLFWKSEYRFADFRSIGPGLAERTHPCVQTVRTELVWRFNFGKGPVRAAY
jgi:hypothetical protein